MRIKHQEALLAAVKDVLFVPVDRAASLGSGIDAVYTAEANGLDGKLAALRKVFEEVWEASRT